MSDINELKPEPVAWRYRLRGEEWHVDADLEQFDKFSSEFADVYPAEPLYSEATILSLLSRVERAEAENERLKSERLYIIGSNDGYEAAMSQAAEFCEGAEASWRETADKAGELDHNEAMGWSERANAKAEACAGLASDIRILMRVPLVRGVDLCLLNEPTATSVTTAPTSDEAQS